MRIGLWTGRADTHFANWQSKLSAKSALRKKPEFVGLFPWSG